MPTITARSANSKKQAEKSAFRLSSEIEKVLIGEADQGFPRPRFEWTQAHISWVAGALFLISIANVAYREHELPLLLGVTLFVGLAGAFVKWVTTPEPVGEDVYEVSVTFQKDAIWLRKQAPGRRATLEQVQDRIARNRIVSIAPFKQMGWFFCRERGITIRLDDGEAIFIALRGSQKDFAAHLQSLSHSLPPLGYTLEKLRSFQP